jgi:hypothetical protein
MAQVWSSVRLLLSIPLVQLRAAQEPNARRARFRAPSGSASLRGLTAPLSAQPFAHETNVSFLAVKAKEP